MNPLLDCYHAEVVERLRRTAEDYLPTPLRGAWAVDDLISEAFAKALSAFERKKQQKPGHAGFFDLPVEMVRKYLRSAIIDVAVDLTRRLSQKKGPGGAVAALDADPLADHTSPSEKSRRNETLERLTTALAALPHDQYRAIQLHHLEGLPYTEVARRMETTPPSVAGLIRRGLATLREYLPECDFDFRYAE